WLAEQAERLIASLNRQRREFARAHIRCLLAKGGSPTFDFESFRTGLLAILGGHAMSIFARDAGTHNLHCVDTTGLEREHGPSGADYDLKDYWDRNPSTASYNLNDDADCDVCRATRQPGKVLRSNWDDCDNPLTQTPNLAAHVRDRNRERIAREG